MNLRQIDYKKLVIMVLVVILAVVAVITYLFFSVRQTVADYAQSAASNIAFKIANNVTAQEIMRADMQYSDIVALSQNSAGDISSLQIDVAKINYLKSTIAEKINNEVVKNGKCTVSIPVGTLFGNVYTVGLGPSVKFKMQIATTVDTDFESNFYSAGINQVLHQILIKININGSLVIPWYQTGFSTSTSVIAAQTVLVGLTPEAYTSVTEAADKTIGDIFDYGAKTE